MGHGPRVIVAKSDVTPAQRQVVRALTWSHPGAKIELKRCRFGADLNDGAGGSDGVKGVGKVVLEIVVLTGVGCALGLSVNALRADGSLTLTKNYFARPAGEIRQAAMPVAATGSQATPRAAAPTGNAPPPARPDAAAPPRAAVDQKAAPLPPPEEPSEEDQSDSDWLGVQKVSSDEVCAMFEDPDRMAGLILFIDARDDANYNDGHIPGAVQFDHYRLEQYLPKVLPLTRSAKKIVVYCHGGDCEDSLFACEDLFQAGVPFEKVFLFAGGMEEWRQMGMPVANGGDS
jgi:rhodanese-related sulfurtransferase